MKNIDISIVIPVKNGQRYLDEVLRSIFSQEINMQFEVIIIDSASADKTIEIVNRYPVQLYQINAEDFNHGLTRNFGISKAKGKYVILLSQDAIPADNHWLKALADNFIQDEEVVGVYSRQIPHQDANIITKIRVSKFLTFETDKRLSKIDKIKDFKSLSFKEKHQLCSFDNVASCIRRTAWEKIPFTQADFGEDLIWAKQVLEAGYKIIYEPKSVVCHAHNLSIISWYNRNRINSLRLSILFGTANVNSIFKVLLYGIFYILKDIRLLFKNKFKLKHILLNVPLVPFYAFSGILGQYKGFQESTEMSSYEDTPDST
jgi:rhamnosyltransferase